MKNKIIISEMLTRTRRTEIEKGMMRLFYKSGIKPPKRLLPTYMTENQSIESLFSQRARQILQNLKNEDYIINEEPLEINDSGTKKYLKMKKQILENTGIDVTKII